MTERSVQASTIGLLARAIRTADAPSPAAIEQAKLLLLDTIACGFAGRSEIVARAALNAASELGKCAVIGQSARASLLNTVFVNGVFVRVLDLNDYLIGESHGEPETAGHPSDNIPVALAVGTARERSGRDTLAALVMGYELYARLQQSLDREAGWDGATASGLVAAAIAGRLMNLSEESLAHALALGAARAATPSIVRGGEISAAKSLANALVAQSGVQAAMLAEHGATGPLAILDDARRGLRDVFSRADPESLYAPFSRDGAIRRAHVKTYPCINTGQSAVAAALKLHALIDGRAEALSRIEITMADYKVTKRHQEDAERLNPTSREAADHSYPFIVAVALLDGRLSAEQFDGERWRNDEVRALMSKMVMRRDAGWNARAPGSYPCAIVATDRDGIQRRVEVDYPPGYSRSGLDAKIVVQKFHAVTDRILSREERARIVDSVMQFDHCPSADELNTAIAIEGTPK